MTRIARVYTLEPTQVMFPMPDNTSGTYRLEVRRRHLKGKGNPVIGRMDEPVVPM